MPGREVKDDLMIRLAQKGLAGCFASEHPRLAFDAEPVLETAVARNQANDGFGEVDVEIVADDVPPGVGGGAAQLAAEKSGEILLGARVTDHASDLAGGDVERGDQGLSAMAAVLELTPLDLAGHHRQSRRDALQGLNAGHLVDRDRAMGCRQRWPQPCRSRRCRRTWHRRRDWASGSANNGRDAA